MEDTYTIAAGNWQVMRPKSDGMDTQDAVPAASGTFTMTPLTKPAPGALNDELPIDQQISSGLHYTMKRDGVEYPCCLYFVYGKEVHDNMDRMFYEDLTDYYKAKYPAAGVTAVINRYVNRHKPS